jgi:Arm domain-containing DNA-binding protein
MTAVMRPEERYTSANRPMDADSDVMTTQLSQAEPRPDLAWDDQARGLCTRVYADGSQSFIFVYRVNDRQRFIRIGKTPVWSLEAARKRANKLRDVVDQGGDPANYNREQEKLRPVEAVIEYIAEHLRS